MIGILLYTTSFVGVVLCIFVAQLCFAVFVELFR